METYSLRRRALTAASLPLVLTAIAALSIAFWFSFREISQLYDTHMMQMAKTLRLLTWHEAMEAENLGEVLSVDADKLHTLYDTFTAYRIWSKRVLVTATPSAEPLNDEPAPEGFSTQQIGAHEWRLFVLHDKESDIVVEVAENGIMRQNVVRQILVSLATPMFILMACTIAILAVGLGRSFKPLEQLSQEVDARDANDIHPLQRCTIPQEISPLFLALNRLFIRVQEALTREREFTDNAAHELRTPLAAIKTQTQVLMRHLPKDPALHTKAEALLGGVNRATQLVDQMLAFARLQHQTLVLEEVDLSAISRQAVAEAYPAAEVKKQKLTMTVAPQVFIQGHTGALAILLRNLLDNAIRYTPEGGNIRVSLENLPEITLKVTDDGPGISAAERAYVCERFTRIDTAKTGSGLGLAIVSWIAEAHHAQLQLETNTPHGLRVCVRFR